MKIISKHDETNLAFKIVFDVLNDHYHFFHVFPSLLDMEVIIMDVNDADFNSRILERYHRHVHANYFTGKECVFFLKIGDIPTAMFMNLDIVIDTPFIHWNLDHVVYLLMTSLKNENYIKDEDILNHVHPIANIIDDVLTTL